MVRRTDFRKATTYTGQKIKGIVEISYKIDGVRLLRRDGQLVTRNNKIPPGAHIAFTDDMRKQLWDNPDQYIGRMMEVQYKELFESGSFRYAVTFLRFRDDKDTESFDTKGDMK